MSKPIIGQTNGQGPSLKPRDNLLFLTLTIKLHFISKEMMSRI